MTPEVHVTLHLDYQVFITRPKIYCHSFKDHSPLDWAKNPMKHPSSSKNTLSFS